MTKKIITFILALICLLISSLEAQDITGDWNGVLDVMETQLTLVFHIQQSDSGYTAALAVKELPGLNHMFQESETGPVMEYAEIEQTFSPDALSEISEWVKDHVEM